MGEGRGVARAGMGHDLHLLRVGLELGRRVEHKHLARALERERRVRLFRAVGNLLPYGVREHAHKVLTVLAVEAVDAGLEDLAETALM